jgi:hypothetical protein
MLTRGNVCTPPMINSASRISALSTSVYRGNDFRGNRETPSQQCNDVHCVLTVHLCRIWPGQLCPLCTPLYDVVIGEQWSSQRHSETAQIEPPGSQPREESLR